MHCKTKACFNSVRQKVQNRDFDFKIFSAFQQKVSLIRKSVPLQSMMLRFKPFNILTIGNYEELLLSYRVDLKWP